jgi:hypothetical protein
MDTIKCIPCGQENDLTRVFCKNCGVRLERPEGVQATIAGNSPVMGRSPAKKKRFSPGAGEGIGSALKRIVRAVLSTAILAAVLALFIQMGRKPDNIPDAQPANEARAAQLYQSVKAFGDTIYPRALDVTQSQVNNYLAVRLVPADGGSSYRPTFKRAFVVIENGQMKYYVEQRLYGWPIFMGVNAVSEASVNERTGLPAPALRVTGGTVGRLKIPAQMLPILQRNLQRVIDSTSDATDVLLRANAIEFKPGAAKLSWQGARAPGH